MGGCGLADRAEIEVVVGRIEIQPWCTKAT
jgi:hypothetical protein